MQTNAVHTALTADAYDRHFIMHELGSQAIIELAIYIIG